MSLIKLVDWDSQLFGFPIAALNTAKLTADIMSLAATEIAQQKIHMLQYLCPCDDIDSIYQAEVEMFHFVDARLTYQKKLVSLDIAPEKKDGIYFGIANESHIPELMIISESLYQDTRYYADQHFPRDKVHVLHKTWLANAVHGKFDHICYCLFIDNNPIGFCSVRYNNQHTATLGLFGIAKEHQRKSLGNYLLQLACADLFSKGYKEILVVTQGKNYGAQRTYQSNGFKSLKVEMWYHKWFSHAS
jgi:ribosomal protein S18 acetylase RimI-like enzyme